ncbi:hypothetical protein KSX_18500 [Ktedonospora formicarum]|uniref:BACON domain-containing protein n=1 Tax=Ktedonospora formicarum TaxID=2778364 RepID=A0A8J3HZV6_9CHLR|nr:hypothetical protein KSX_18500 [Ktedonospora formicarum]
MPPASPHRAGHYAGLHPEDHPYHSNLLATQHPTITHHNDHKEVWEEDSEDNANIAPIEPQVRRASLRTQTTNIQVDSTHTEMEMADVPTHKNSLNHEPETEHAPRVASPETRRSRREPISEPPVALSQPRRTRSRLLSVLLLLACLLFLIASSILAFLLIGNKPTITRASVVASPNQLRINDTFLLRGSGFGARDHLTLTYDGSRSIPADNGKALIASTNSQGSFSLEIRVTKAWSIGTHDIHVTDERLRLSVSTSITIQPTPVGSPHLQISATRLDLGTAASGTIAEHDLTLINTGGGSINWQVSSDQPWLSSTPASGSFSGRTNIQIKANRGTLQPRTYTGHLLFRATNGADQTPIFLTVMLGVEKPTSSSLVVSTASLAFSTGAGLNPAAQTLVLQNTGDQPLTWTGATLTGDGSPWLSLSPAEGQLPAHRSAIITVSLQTAQLTVGTYQGTLNFTSAENSIPVGVSLNVLAAGNLVVSPPTLSFSMIVGQQPDDQQLTLQNTGALPLDWVASATTSNGGDWLHTLSPNGSLNAGQQSTLAVHIDGGNLAPGSYQGTLILRYGEQQKQIAISLTVSPPPAPAISISPTSLTFDTTRGRDFTAQLIALTNVGDAPLNWKVSFSGAPVGISLTQGTLYPGESQVLSIIPTGSISTAGISTGTITFAHTDTSQKVPSRPLNVTIQIE